MYESWFQLEKRPFGAAPQVNDYFPARSIEAARHAIVRGLEANAGPGLVIGGTGMGKTTLCLRLRQQYRDTLPVAYLSCCGIQSRRELLQNMLLTFELPYADKDDGELRISLTNFAREAKDHSILLILDDADDLATEVLEELRWLSNITHEGNWCVQLLLAGKNRLEERLGSAGMESFDQRISSRNYLSPATAQETAEFIQFQITRCGGDASRIFSDAALEEIHTATDGVPRLVNQLCDQALIMATLAKVQCLEQLHIEEAWADLQQMPAPKRSSAAQPATGNGDIEFGALDQDEAPAVKQESPETNESQDDQASNPVVNQPRETECGEPLIEFGELATDHGEYDSSSASPPPTSPEFDFVDMDGSPWHGSEGEPAEATEGLRSHSQSAEEDLVERLDDIEREVQRVSVELHGEAKQRANAHAQVSVGNPFLEVFDEDELVFSSHTTLHNEVVRRQPPVFTGGGESLINVMRMVDQRGPTETPWERCDDINKPDPPDPRLAEEVAPLPLRELPDLTQANTDSVQFSEGEFRFNYAAPIGDAPPQGNEITESASGPSTPTMGNNITGSTNHLDTLVICSSSGQQVVHIPQSGLVSAAEPAAPTGAAPSGPTAAPDSLPTTDEIVAVVDDSPVIDSFPTSRETHDQASDLPTSLIPPDLPTSLTPPDLPTSLTPPPANVGISDTGSDSGHDSHNDEVETASTADGQTLTEPAAAQSPITGGDEAVELSPVTPPTAMKRPKRGRFNKLFSDLKTGDADNQ